ncbi:hypothetical protein DXT66_30215 (plasmid) [Nocardia farcinica]|nr:hypothetical protein DXT66_30215 [Nocardia farcinica]
MPRPSRILAHDQPAPSTETSSADHQFAGMPRHLEEPWMNHKHGDETLDRIVHPVEVTAANAMRAEGQLIDAVRTARAQGASWQAIAAAAGVSPLEAERRWATRTHTPLAELGAAVIEPWKTRLANYDHAQVERPENPRALVADLLLATTHARQLLDEITAVTDRLADTQDTVVATAADTASTALSAGADTADQQARHLRTALTQLGTIDKHDR